MKCVGLHDHHEQRNMKKILTQLRFDFSLDPTKTFSVMTKVLTYKSQGELYTVNIYRYKALGANATSSVILYTGKCICPCLEIL